MDVERLPVWAPHSTEKGSDFGDEVGWCADSETARADGQANNVIDWCESQVKHFVPEDGVLAPREVRLTKEDEDL